MVYKRNWRRSPLGLPRIANAFCNGCVSLPNFDLFIISLSVKRIYVVSFKTGPYAVALMLSTRH